MFLLSGHIKLTDLSSSCQTCTGHQVHLRKPQLTVFSLAENLSKTDPWLKQTWHRSAAKIPAPHQTRSHTDVPILLCSMTSLFTPILKQCYVVHLLKLPDGEGLICWVTQIYTVPMERLCSFNEFIYGNDAQLHLEYGISGHWAVNNLPLDKHGPSKSKTLFNIQKPVCNIFIDVVWTCVIRRWSQKPGFW